MSELFKPESLKLDGNVSQNFRKFRQEIEMYFLPTEWSKKSKEVQMTTLLNLMGEDARQMYYQIEEEITEKSVTNVLDALEKKFLAKANVVQNQVTFFQCRQNAGESFEQYYARLRELIRVSHFGDAEKSLMRTQIVMGINNKKLQQELTEKNLDLEDTLKYCRANEVFGNCDQKSDNASLESKALRSPSVQNNFNRRMIESAERVLLNLARIRSMGKMTREYAKKLAADKTTLFAKNIEHFVCCTVVSKETNASVVMKNVRQFITGMKNYLVKHGERDFLNVVERERIQLNSSEFLNLDMILEGVISWLVLKELGEHIRKLIYDEHVANGSIAQVEENIRFVESKSIQDFTFRKDLMPPDENDFKKISDCFKRLEKTISPFEKLEQLILAINVILNAVRKRNPDADSRFGADEFLSLIMWSVVKCDAHSVELDAAYMQGLLHPLITSGECGYHLTALGGAVQTLKRYKLLVTSGGGRVGCGDGSSTVEPWRHGQQASRIVFEVVIPDETNGSLLTKTLSVRPQVTVRDVCKSIAKKLCITNAHDYSLFKLNDGRDNLLLATDCLQDIKCSADNRCLLMYKRIDARIALPRLSYYLPEI